MATAKMVDPLYDVFTTRGREIINGLFDEPERNLAATLVVMALRAIKDHKPSSLVELDFLESDLGGLCMEACGLNDEAIIDQCYAWLAEMTPRELRWARKIAMACQESPLGD